MEVINVKTLEGLTITVNLKGAIGGPVEHKDIQEDHTRVGAFVKNFKYVYTPRQEQKCVRVVNISREVALGWASENCPEWANPHDWAKMGKAKKILATVARFNEGFGVSFNVL